LQRMALHLSHAQGSAVLLATTPDADLARALAEELQTRLTGHVLRSFHFAPDRLDLPAFLRTLPLPDPERRSVVFGLGLDDLPAADRERAMDELNLGRETLRWTGHSVVLWLRPPTVQQITFQAPDFFAVRSGVFDFTAPTDGADREETLRALNVNGAATLPDLRERYLNYDVSTYRWLDFRGLMQVRNLVRLPLQAVFVPLRADISASQSVSSKLRVSMLFGDSVVGEVNPKTTGWTPEVQDFVPDFRFQQHRREPDQEQQNVDLSEVLREKSRLVVLGDPGSGKSTLLKYLALTFAEGAAAARERLKLDKTRLPILVPISAYALALRGRDTSDRVGAGLPLAEGDHKGRALLDFLPQHFGSLGLPNLGPLFEQALNAGEAIILLDGLDEVLDTATRERVAREVGALAAAYPRCRFVVTSRIAGYSSAALGAGFATVTVRPFERPEIELFARQWSRAYESLNVGQDAILSNTLPPEAEIRAEARAKSLTDAIFANPAIERLATTPLLLTLLALIHHQGTRLPNRRVELYRLCVEALAETWNLARSQAGQPIELWLGERRLDEREVVRLLAPVAFHMHERQPGGLITRAELEALIAEQLRDEHGDRAPALAHQFVELVREQVGLMLERGPDLFGFMHLTFEEYLAARYLVAKRDPFPLVKPHLHAPRWQEVILLTAASPELAGDRATDFVRALYEANSPLNGVLHLDLFLAARCLADDVHVDAALRREVVTEVVELALRGEFDKLREEAAGLIGALGGTAAGQDALPTLLAALQDESEDVRGSAAEALERLGQTSDVVVSALLTALQDESEDVRESAAEALGRLGQTSDVVVSALLAALQDESKDVRESAAVSLGQLGQTSEAVVSALLIALRDKNSSVRRSAAVSLGQVGQASEAVVSALVAALRDEDSIVRRFAAIALEWVGQTSEAVVSALLTAVRDEDSIVRGNAAAALGPLGQTSDVVVSVLLAALRDEEGYVRMHATAALGQLGQTSDAVVSALLAALQGESEDVRGSAAAALGRLGQTYDAVVSALLAALQDESEDVRGSAAEALGRLGQTSDVVVSALLAALQDESEDVRESAAVSLGQLGQTSEAVVSALLAALQDESEDVRGSAAEALGRLGQTSDVVVSALLTALRGESEDVRGSAAVSLGQLGQTSEAVVSALMGALRDKNSSVRERAAEALERLGYPSPAVISALRDRLDDRGTVSDAAFAALWQLAPKRYEEGVSTDAFNG